MEGDYRFPSAAEYIHDILTNYVTCAHLQDSMKWLIKAGHSTDPSTKRIFEHHRDAANLCKDLKWNYEVVDTPPAQ